MHNEKQKKETRGRKPILDDQEKRETIRLGFKRKTIEKNGGYENFRNKILKNYEK